MESPPKQRGLSGSTDLFTSKKRTTTSRRVRRSVDIDRVVLRGAVMRELFNYTGILGRSRACSCPAGAAPAALLSEKKSNNTKIQPEGVDRWRSRKHIQQTLRSHWIHVAPLTLMVLLLMEVKIIIDTEVQLTAVPLISSAK